jgi:hypothetical protein
MQTFARFLSPATRFERPFATRALYQRISSVLKTTGIGALAFLSLICVAMAWPKGPQCNGETHTLHELVVLGGNATCVLSRLYEPLSFCLVSASGADLDGVPVRVSASAPLSWGLVIADGADFNMEYAATCVKADGGFQQSPKVTFLVGTDGPATARITTVDLYGAVGNWTSTGGGENFTITFP